MNFHAQNNKIKLVVETDDQHAYMLKSIIGDRRRFLQIMLNFISNSLKFTDEGGTIKVILRVLEY